MGNMCKKYALKKNYLQCFTAFFSLRNQLNCAFVYAHCKIIICGPHRTQKQMYIYLFFSMCETHSTAKPVF